MCERVPEFDYTFDTPWTVTAEIEREMEQAATDGESVAEAFSQAELDRLRDDPTFRKQYHDTYRDADVDVLSVTVGSRVDPDVPLSAGIWRDLARWQHRFDLLPWFRKVTTPAEARAVAASDDVGIVLNTQNLEAAIDGDASKVRDLYAAGIRIMQLTYNRQNLVGTGCTDYSEGGLSAHGQTVVDEIVDLGAVLDLSHCNEETTQSALEYADNPVAFTHVSCGALANHDRAKSDEELRALAAVDGYVGIVAIPSFLAPDRADPSFDVFFEHLDHAISVVGVDRVGIGTDFLNLDVDVPDQLLPEVRARAEESLFREEHRATDGLGTGFGPFRRYTDWDVIREGVRERYGDDAKKILGGNFVSFWERVRS
jgi:membrane dipeptidase